MSLNVLSLTGKNLDPYVLRNDVVSVLESVPDENPLALSCHEAAANIADDRQYEQIDELTMMAGKKAPKKKTGKSRSADSSSSSPTTALAGSA